MGKHTEEFTKQYWKSLEKEPTFAEAENFVLGLSRERTDKVISQIIAKTKRTIIIIGNTIFPYNVIYSLTRSKLSANLTPR